MAQNTKHGHSTDTSVDQYLHDQIRKAVGQLEDRQALPTEPKGPSRQQVQDHGSGPCRKRSIHLEKKESNGNAPPYHEIRGPMMGTKVITLPSSRVAWLALNVKGG